MVQLVHSSVPRNFLACFTAGNSITTAGPHAATIPFYYCLPSSISQPHLHLLQIYIHTHIHVVKTFSVNVYYTTAINNVEIIRGTDGTVFLLPLEVMWSQSFGWFVSENILWGFEDQFVASGQSVMHNSCVVPYWNLECLIFSTPSGSFYECRRVSRCSRPAVTR